MNAVPKQTEAQRLADSISRIDTFTEHQRSEIQKAAAILLRQDELLGRALEALSSASNVVVGEYGPEDALSKECENVIAAIRAHREAK